MKNNPFEEKLKKKFILQQALSTLYELKTGLSESEMDSTADQKLDTAINSIEYIINNIH